MSIDAFGVNRSAGFLCPDPSGTARSAGIKGSIGVEHRVVRQAAAGRAVERPPAAGDTGPAAYAVDHPHRPVGTAQALLHRRLGLVHPQAALIHAVGLGAHLSPLSPSITAGIHCGLGVN
jgi:hypothetical protein